MTTNLASLLFGAYRRDVLALLLLHPELSLHVREIARGDERAGSDIDLMILGKAKFAEVVRALARARGTLRREIDRGPESGRASRSRLSRNHAGRAGRNAGERLPACDQRTGHRQMHIQALPKTAGISADRIRALDAYRAARDLSDCRGVPVSNAVAQECAAEAASILTEVRAWIAATSPERAMAQTAQSPRKKPTVSHRERLVSELRADPERGAEYLSAAAEDPDCGA